MRKIVCLDAGHDAGNTANASPDKTFYEHEFTLDMSKRIATNLVRCGIDVVQTRPDGKKVTLEERVHISDAAAADVFLSIHSNAAGNEGWYAAEGMTAYVAFKGYGAEKLADNIRTSCVTALGCHDRGTVAKGLQVIKDTEATAALIEYGFHTNREEVEKLKADSYRAKAAEATASAICEYLGVKYKQPPDSADALAARIDAVIDELQRIREAM